MDALLVVTWNLSYFDLPVAGVKAGQPGPGRKLWFFLICRPGYEGLCTGKSEATSRAETTITFLILLFLCSVFHRSFPYFIICLKHLIFNLN